MCPAENTLDAAYLKHQVEALAKWPAEGRCVPDL